MFVAYVCICVGVSLLNYVNLTIYIRFKSNQFNLDWARCWHSHSHSHSHLHQRNIISISIHVFCLWQNMQLLFCTAYCLIYIEWTFLTIHLLIHWRELGTRWVLRAVLFYFCVCEWGMSKLLHSCVKRFLNIDIIKMQIKQKQDNL